VRWKFGMRPGFAHTILRSTVRIGQPIFDPTIAFEGKLISRKPGQFGLPEAPKQESGHVGHVTRLV
jgi:hypothetical protein